MSSFYLFCSVSWRIVSSSKNFIKISKFHDSAILFQSKTNEIGEWYLSELNFQIYAPRLDDPSSQAFEQCSSDTFQIYGPCAYQICYVYLYRTGPDGWKPESVKIYGYNSKAVTFYYNTYVPADTWFGVNLCGNAASWSPHFGRSCFLVVIVFVAMLYGLLWVMSCDSVISETRVVNFWYIAMLRSIWSIFPLISFND